MKKMKITQRDYIKANRKASREAEIENHTRPINFCRVQKSKKVYDRKRSKAENKKALPYLYLYLIIDNTFTTGTTFCSRKFYHCNKVARNHPNKTIE